MQAEYAIQSALLLIRCCVTDLDGAWERFHMVAKREATAFGVLLRRYRQRAGLTQEALAEHAALSARGISDLERGVNRAPRPVTLGLLARALKLSASEQQRLEAAAHAADLAVSAATSGAQPEATWPPFVGRTDELAMLAQHLAGMEPSVLVVAGEPGIGKSRLLQEAASRAARAGWAVLAGGCQRRGSQEPFAPLSEALDRHLESCPPERLCTALDGCAWLVRLLPELASPRARLSRCLTGRFPRSRNAGCSSKRWSAS